MPTATELTELKEMCRDMSVLMVEDDIALADSYKTMAAKFFKSVSVVYDPFEAIEQHRPGKFDIIYTDINMPGMSGIEMICEIKKHDKDQKFIVISASDESDNLLNLLKLNISAFILKPFGIDNFIQTTREQVSVILQTRRMAQKASRLQEELREVTKEKDEQERILIQQTKLAQTGEMISMIAHQWRQPLSSITTLVAALKTRLELGIYEKSPDPLKALTTDLYEMFGQIEQSAEFLSKTINDFRNFYRPDNAAKTFSAIDAVESVLRMLVVDNEKITLTREYCKECDATVTTYEGEFQQVLISIINNAKDAMAENGIKEPKLDITVSKTDGSLCIRICDNGGGIPEDIIEHIFLPYFSTKSEKNGTGIGLHMAKTIIEHHLNGSLSAANNPVEKGACFSLIIPLDQHEGA